MIAMTAMTNDQILWCILGVQFIVGMIVVGFLTWSDS
jgi:hypothetical protein